MAMEAPQQNLALEILRVTESAALSAARWLGKGEKILGDKAAVDAMRLSFNSLPIQGTVIIGEGEKDEAPMLYNGEKLGTGTGMAVDVAVDPVEGTNLLALGRPNAITVVGMAQAGSMFNPGPSYYMKKLVVPPQAKNVVELDAPVLENLKSIARSLEKDVEDLVVFVLDKPRHQKLIAEIRKAGARIQLHTDGDVAGSLMAVDTTFDVDVMMGTGGTPEGVLSACAIRGVGGRLLARLNPQSENEKQRILDAGIDLQETLTEKSLVRDDDPLFAATGLSGGTFLQGVRYEGNGACTHSLVIRGKTGTVRYLQSRHNWDKLMKFSALNYD